MKKKTIVFVQNVEYPQQGAVDMFYYSKYLSKYKDIQVKVITAKINEDISHKNLEIIELGDMNYVMFIIKSFFLIKNLKKEEGIEYVYFFAQNPLSVVLQFFVKYLLGIKTVYDVVSGPIGKGIISFTSKYTIRLGVFLSNFYVVLDMRLIKKIKLNRKKKHLIIAMGYDEDIFYEKKGKNLFNKLDNEIIFTYIGTLSKERRLDVFIRAFISNITDCNNVELYFIGGGTGEERLKEISGKYLNKNIFFLGIQKHKDIPDYINSSDILVSYVPKIDYFEYQPPTKLIEYLACDKVVMVTNTIAQEEIMVNIKQSIHTDDYDATNKKIKYLIDNFSQISKLDFYSLVEEYSWDKLVSKIYSKIQS